MTKVITDEDDFFDDKNTSICLNCNEPLHYPFVSWHGFPHNTCIWGECCSHIKSGLMADMIHCSALTEMRGLSGLHNRNDPTLVRRSLRAGLDR